MDKEDQSVEDMMAQVQLLELQAKRMQKLVEQRKQERAGLNFYLILDLSPNVNRKPNFWEGLKNNA